MIEKQGVRFEYMEMKARVDNFSDEIAAELASIGVEELSFGVETVSPKLLRFLNKRTTPEQIYNASKICKKHGIALRISLMFGIPTQDQEDYDLTMRYIEACEPDSIMCFYFTPFPGTWLFEYCLQNGHMPDNWAYDNLIHINPSQSEFRGWWHTPGVLKNVDYKMGAFYWDKVNEFEIIKQNAAILKAARVADRNKWIVVGTKKYIFEALERLSQHKWNNLLGWYSLSEGDFQQKKHVFSVEKYDWDQPGPRPETIVATIHKGHYYKNVLIPMMEKRFGFTGPILSASTWPESCDN